MDWANQAHDDLRGGLVRAVRRLAAGRTWAPLPALGWRTSTCLPEAGFAEILDPQVDVIRMIPR
jgi:hypothetical protein